ncbi:MAG TPA: hypothetical protein VIA06_14080 [Candidatus Dormibacteraeota bacterium]|jgi:hypothetical protein|nr:hypothetical protein [Candidatus Dormibacteraeota bacterium]
MAAVQLDPGQGGEEHDPLARPLTELGLELRGCVQPDGWRAADRTERIRQAGRAHGAICHRLALPVTELTFEHGRVTGLAWHDQMTERVIGSMLLVNDPDPSPVIRALVRENWFRARGRMLRNRRWLREGPLAVLRRAGSSRRETRRPAVDVRRLPADEAAERVLAAFRGADA